MLYSVADYVIACDDNIYKLTLKPYASFITNPVLIQCSEMFSRVLDSFSVSLRSQLLDLGLEGGEVEPDGHVLAETDEATHDIESKQSFHVFFEEPVLLVAQRYVFDIVPKCGMHYIH